MVPFGGGSFWWHYYTAMAAFTSLLIMCSQSISSFIHITSYTCITHTHIFGGRGGWRGIGSGWRACADEQWVHHLTGSCLLAVKFYPLSFILWISPLIMRTKYNETDVADTYRNENSHHKRHRKRRYYYYYSCDFYYSSLI